MKKSVLVVIVLLLIGGLGYGVFMVKMKSQTPQMKPQMEMPPLPVMVYDPKESPKGITKSYATVIKPFAQVPIVARIQGTLESKHFSEGELIKKGQLLYTIDKATYEAKLIYAQSSYQKAKTLVVKTQKDFERAKTLLASHSLSQQAYDGYEFAYEDAKAGLKSSEANLKMAQIEYDYTKVYAPINGFVGIESYDLGDLVGGNGSAPLATITNTNVVYAEFSLPVADLKLYQKQLKNNTLKVVLQGAQKAYGGGIIDYIAPNVDPQTDTVLVRALFYNKAHEILAGEFAKIELQGIAIGKGKIIPENALLKTPKGTFVYLAKDGIATLAPVNVGIVTSQGVVVEGVQAGDQVIVSNIAKLRPEAKIQIIPNQADSQESEKK